MLRAVIVLACLSLACSSPAEPHLRTHIHKDMSTILANIEERLRVLDVIGTVQAKQARRLEVIQDKLDRVETTLSLRLERAQLAAERLEHRLHMLQTSIQASIKESSDKIELSQTKIANIAQNLTTHLESHRHLLEKVSGAYAETWRRGLLLESLMRDGLSLVNVTRRELADGLRTLARRHRDARLTTSDLEAAFTRRVNDNTQRIDLKMQELLDVQKHFIDSCQRVQLDDPSHVADVLDKLIDSMINKTASTYHELETMQVLMRNHDNKVMKLLNSGRITQSDTSCRRLEVAFRNASFTNLKGNELQALIQKFVSLTERADAALQRLDAKLGEEKDEPSTSSDVTAEADRLLLKLKGIKTEQDSDDTDEWEEDQERGYYDDGGGGDLFEEDKNLLSGNSGKDTEYTIRQPSHRRHLHKHPYDRGPSWRTST